MGGLRLGFGLGVDRLSGGGGGAVTQGLAANRGYLPTRTLTGNNLTFKSEHWSSPQGAISRLRPMWCGIYYYASTLVLTAAPANYTIEASIEYPAGTFTRITFGGANQGVVPVDGVLTGDDMGVAIPAGTRFWIRTYIASIASGTIIPASQLPGLPNMTGITDGAIGGNSVMSGTINPSISGNTHGPFAIMGTIAAANARSWALLGDSVMWGANDDAGKGAAGGAGAFARALDPLYPWVNFARGSGLGTYFDNNVTRLTTLRNAMDAYGGVTDVMSNYGINDLKTGSTVAEVKTAIANIFAVFSGKRTYQATLGPRTTSVSSNWTVTPGDQVPQTDGRWPDMPIFNSDVRAVLPGATGYIEAGDLYQSARDSGYWAAHSPSWAADGTHLSTAGAAGVAALLAIP